MWSGFSARFHNGAEAAGKATVHTKGKVDHFGSKGGSSATLKKRGFVVGWLEKSYLVGLVAVEIWGQFLHPLFLGDKLPFMPLMLISISCAFGIMYSWIWQLRSIVGSVDL